MCFWAYRQKNQDTFNFGNSGFPRCHMGEHPKSNFGNTMDGGNNNEGSSSKEISPKVMELLSQAVVFPKPTIFS